LVGKVIGIDVDGYDGNRADAARGRHACDQAVLGGWPGRLKMEVQA
jgi:hypothetical protein